MMKKTQNTNKKFNESKRVNKMEDNAMRKRNLVMLMMLVVMVFALSACGKKDNIDNNKDIGQVNHVTNSDCSSVEDTTEKDKVVGQVCRSCGVVSINGQDKLLERLQAANPGVTFTLEDVATHQNNSPFVKVDWGNGEVTSVHSCAGSFEQCYYY